ncbi:MAG TPA: hypothetical protein VGK37_07090 [Casimicrobiaceae bacterium]|jgi:hypothetical protein
MVHGRDGSILMGTLRNPWLWPVAALIVMFAVSSRLSAAQFVYPAKGQSAGQQKKDEGECGKWAVDKSGFDPAKPSAAAAPPAPATTATGTTPGAGARGAARGAVVGGIMGDAGAGAAAGAVAARGQSRRQNAAQQQQTTQQQQQVDSAQQGAYLKARAACLEGRGYTVK